MCAPYMAVRGHGRLRRGRREARVVVAETWLWEIVSSIEGNCFKTSHLLMENNFGRSPKFIYNLLSAELSSQTWELLIDVQCSLSSI